MKNTFLYILFAFLFFFSTLHGQDLKKGKAGNMGIPAPEGSTFGSGPNPSNTDVKDSIVGPKTYTISEIVISGNSLYTRDQIIALTGLGLGEEITLPSIKTEEAIKKLVKKDLFSEIELFATPIGNQVSLRYNLSDFLTVNEFSVIGDVNKSFGDDLIKDNNLEKGMQITPRLKEKITQYAKGKLTEKGFAQSSVEFKETPASSLEGFSNLEVIVKKGVRTRIEKINFKGNEFLSEAKLRKALKNTKTPLQNPIKKSKFDPKLFEQDIVSLRDLYHSKGYRDVQITQKEAKLGPKGYVVDIAVEEGPLYTIGDISFVGNAQFNTEDLEKIIGYKKGDPYDAIGFKNKIMGSQNDDDLTTLYLDTGFLFSNITFVEKQVKDHTVDLQVRINEGKQAVLNKITFEGNNVTHDHVIARSLRTRPGDLFSKSLIKRTVFDLAGMGFFENEQIEPQVIPNQQEGTVDINWKLVEKGSSKIEFQGGYGGGGGVGSTAFRDNITGTIGVTLNNFSLSNFLKGNPFEISPLGDGQTLSVRGQIGTGFQTFSFGFVEPWLGGKRPASLSINASYSNFNISDGRLNIYSGTVGLRNRLNWPDDYFSLSQSLNYKLYDYQNYQISAGGINLEPTGTTHNLNYKVALSRYSRGPDPIFPTSGSDFEVSLKVTPPYSLLGLKEEVAENTVLEYFKIGARNYWYKELPGKFVLKAGGEAGFMGKYDQSQDFSAFERFFLGGVGLTGGRFDGREIIPLRGYPEATTPGGSASDVTPLGGGIIYNKLAMELRYPISNGQYKIYALGFFDAANTWGDLGSFNPLDLKKSAGVGVRLFLPQLGLIGADYGYGFDPISSFSDKPSGWQFHFVFGQEI
ncbi:MAG: outer membrane protein assembly factor BamA [Flavobacteriaceae bacterium]|nr:MAG: outer membrane protein assembly factor BamA [Flavobacteriaceae bacterium]